MKYPNSNARQIIKNLLWQGKIIIVPDNYNWFFFIRGGFFYIFNPKKVKQDLSFVTSNLSSFLSSDDDDRVIIRVTSNDFYNTLYAMLKRFPSFIIDGEVYYLSSAGELVNVVSKEES